MLQINLHSAKENISTPLPFLVPKFSKNSEQTDIIPNRLNVTDQGNEFSTFPNFSNVKFQNLYFKDKITNEKKIIFSKLIMKNDIDEKKEVLGELPDAKRTEHVSANVSGIGKNNNSNYIFTNLSDFNKIKTKNHSKNLSNTNISAKPLLKKDNFNTTLGYFKYLIEKSQSTKKLNTNFMIKDQFLIFSKKFNRGKEIIHQNNSNHDNKKSYHKMLIDYKNIKSKRIFSEHESQNIQLEINPSKSKNLFPNSFSKTNTCINNKIPDFISKNFRRNKVFQNDAQDELITKKKLKNIVESNKK